MECDIEESVLEGERYFYQESHPRGAEYLRWFSKDT
jgi:hypothetical protein